MKKGLDIVIVDDELKAAEVLEALIQYYFKEDINKITIFTDPLIALEALANEDPHLIFLDIRMPEMSGMEFADQLNIRNTEIIFVTAYSEYAIKAIRAKAFDYLVKPVDEDDLIKAIERLKLSLIEKSKSAKNELRKKTILLRDSDKVIFQEIDEIIRAEGFSNYSRIFREGGKCIVSSKTLKEYESILVPHGFLRVHKSHLINPLYVKSIVKGGELFLSNGDTIPIAKRRKREVKALLNHKMGIT